MILVGVDGASFCVRDKASFCVRVAVGTILSMEAVLVTVLITVEVVSVLVTSDPDFDLELSKDLVELRSELVSVMLKYDDLEILVDSERVW
jgi:hypothetical protein